jgi:hypothetical protein
VARPIGQENDETEIHRPARRPRHGGRRLRIGPRRRPTAHTIDEALARGWTSIAELFVNEGRMSELQALDAAGEMRVRVCP